MRAILLVVGDDDRVDRAVGGRRRGHRAGAFCDQLDDGLLDEQDLDRTAARGASVDVLPAGTAGWVPQTLPRTGGQLIEQVARIARNRNQPAHGAWIRGQREGSVVAVLSGGRHEFVELPRSRSAAVLRDTG